jgi:hypothetical protein
MTEGTVLELLANDLKLDSFSEEFSIQSWPENPGPVTGTSWK